jgi:hypothetical protein
LEAVNSLNAKLDRILKMIELHVEKEPVSKITEVKKEVKKAISKVKKTEKKKATKKKAGKSTSKAK